MPSHKLIYSEELLRESIRLYWRKKIGVAFPILVLSLVVYVTYMVMSGKQNWFVGAIGTATLVAMGLAIASYFVHLRRSLDRLARMGSPEATLEWNDDYFTISSSLGSSKLKWSIVSEVWKFEKIWFLILEGSDSISIPVANASVEELADFMSRLELANAAIHRYS